MLLACGIALGDTLSLPQDSEPLLLSLWGAVELLVLLLLLTKRLALHAPLLVGFATILSGAIAGSLATDGLAHFPAEGVRGVILVGEVVDPPVRVGPRTRLLVKTSSVLGAGDKVRPGTIVAATVTQGRRDGSLPLVYGCRVALKGDIALPPGRRNPGGFDVRKFYAANGIGLTMVARGQGNVRVLEGGGGSALYRQLILPVRERVLRLIDRTVGGDEGEYLKGLLIGVRTGISREDREAFVNAGVAHILAVSGSNVAALASALFFLTGLVRLGRLPRSLLSCVGLLFYMVLTGSQPPVVRATIMGLVLLAGGILQEKSNPLNALGVAAIGIFLAQPRQLFDIGFQLSFSAVLSLLTLYPRANAVIGRIQFRHCAPILWTLRICALSLVASLGTLPLTASAFGRVPVVGVAANVAIVPAAGASLVLGILAAAAEPLSEAVAQSASAVNWLILHSSLLLTRVAGGLECASLETYGVSGWIAAPFYALLALCFFWKRGSRARALFLLFLAAAAVAVLVPSDEWQGKGGLRVSVLDVGQGDAILLQLPDERAVLIDTGPASGAFDSGRETVVPFLKRMGVDSLEAIVLTHRHADHLGGLTSILREFRPGRIVAAGAHGASCGSILASLPGFRIYVLSPPRGAPVRPPGRVFRDANNRSAVLRLVHHSRSALLMGDAGAEVEDLLVRSYGGFLRSDLLKVGHHGSANGTTVPFLEAVRPACSVLSVGMFNRFGHPAAEVIERLRRSSGAVLRTDCGGALLFACDGDSLRRLHWR